MIKIIHQNQIDDETCVSACLAMLTGQHVKQVVNDFHEDYFKHKTGPSKYLRDKGFKVVPIGPDDQEIKPGKTYLITVPSLNQIGKNHQIIGTFENDNFVIYDPQKGRKNNKCYVWEWPDDLKENEYNLDGYILDYEIEPPEVVT